jgi:hypothetical protein
MSSTRFLTMLPFAFAAGLGGCGLYVPQKDLLPRPGPEGSPARFARGIYEENLVRHIVCQIQKGLYRVARDPVLNNDKNRPDWMYTELFTPVKPAAAAHARPPKPQPEAWGTSVTLTIQVDEQGGLSPGVSTVEPFKNAISVFPTAQGGNVVTPQNFTFGIGANASAHATRSETIQFTYANYALLENAKHWDAEYSTAPEGISCAEGLNGVMIESDLAIDQFIMDKAFIAYAGNMTVGGNPYNTFQEQLTFTSSLGGSVSPTWKLVRLTADQNSTLASVARGETNTVIVSMGPIDFSSPVTRIAALELKGSAQAQKAAASTGVATSGSETASH